MRQIRLPTIESTVAVAEYRDRLRRVVDELMEADSTLPLVDATAAAAARLAGEPGSPDWLKLRKRKRAIARVRSTVASIKKAQSRNP